MQQSSSIFPPPSLIWFMLMDSATGKPLKDTSVSSIVRTSLAADVVDQFRKAVHAENPKRLSSFDAAELIVYKNKDAFERKEAPLEEDLLIGNLGGKKADALVVVVPEQNTRLVLDGNSRQTMPNANWKVSGTIPNSSSVSGIRSRMYRNADTQLGFYEQGQPAFHYDESGKNLKINVL